MSYDFSHLSKEELMNALDVVDDQRIWKIAEAVRRGIPYTEIHKITKIDIWFIDKIANLVEMEQSLRACAPRVASGRGGIEKELLKEYQNFEVYLDSPLAIEATKIFTKNMRECFDEDALALVNAGINPLIFDGLKTATTSDDSKMINFIEKPKVIISASGMCDAGRIRHHLKHNLWREECTILFVGYQAMGTLGRRLIEGEKNVKLFGEPIEVKARIESLHGISGHADMNGLLKWLGAFKEAPQRVFVVHGEDTVTEEFAKTVEEKFGYQVYAPFPCSEADLLTNEILSEGVKIPVKAKKPAQRKADAAFERLVAAGKRLLDVIYKNEGLANKDKAKFESQINNLSDKWDI